MPATAEEEWAYWDKKATELRRTQLASVENSATKWAALLTALLGVFSTVAFAGGLTSIDKLADPLAFWMKVITSGAALAAVIAIALFGAVAGGLRLQRNDGLTAASVRSVNTTGADSALKTLNRAKFAALLAASLVLLGSFIVLWAGEGKSETKPSSVLAVIDGRVVCGELGRRADGELTIAGLRADGSSQTYVAVATCP